MGRTPLPPTLSLGLLWQMFTFRNLLVYFFKVEWVARRESEPSLTVPSSGFSEPGLRVFILDLEEGQGGLPPAR